MEREQTSVEREQTAGDPDPESVRIWMVERTSTPDEYNVVITYATPDGTRYLRKNRSQ